MMHSISNVLSRNKIGKNIVAVFHQNDFRKIITAVFSQGMLSFSNFVIGVLMAKYSEKTEYGMYVILFSFIGILGGYQNALINAPLMVKINNKYGHEKIIYISSLSVGKNYIFASILLLASITIITYNIIVRSGSYYESECLMLSAVSMAYVIKEFHRTLNFSNMNTNDIFKMDFINVAVVIAGMLLLIHFEKITSMTGMMILGVGYIGSYLAADKSDMDYSMVNKKSIKIALKENWDYGKWILVGVTSSLCQDRAYIYVITIMMGLSTVADLAASRLFFMPLNLLSLSCAKIIVAKGSHMISIHQNREFRKFIFSFGAILMILSVVYFVIIILTSERILGVFGGKYAGTEFLVFLWGINFLVYMVRSHLSSALIVYREFYKLARYDIFAAILTIFSCIVLTLMFGRSGGIISLILGELATMTLYWRLYLVLDGPAPELKK